MKTSVAFLTCTMLGLFPALLAPPAHAFGGNAGPQSGCTVHDFDPPTIVRTQPNGVIINKINNGDRVRIKSSLFVLYRPHIERMIWQEGHHA